MKARIHGLKALIKSLTRPGVGVAAVALQNRRRFERALWCEGEFVRQRVYYFEEYRAWVKFAVGGGPWTWYSFNIPTPYEHSALDITVSISWVD